MGKLEGQVAAITEGSAGNTALRSFAQARTSDLKGRKIRVRPLSPGQFDTSIYETSTLPKEVVERFRSQTLARTPMRRLEEPEEIANAALFLASDDSRFITGIEQFADGRNAQV